MTEIDDDSDLKNCLQGYLSANLDRQLGRAAAGFQNQALPAHARTAADGRTSRHWSWRSLVALSAAACLALAIVWWSRDRGEIPSAAVDEPPIAPSAVRVEPPPSDSVAPAAYSANRPQLVGQRLRWRTFDEGIVMLDEHTAARKLRRQRFERKQWVDPATGAVMETIVPHEEILFVGLPTY